MATLELSLKRLVQILVACSVTVGSSASADDWGCTVLLCLANPAGPTAVAECIPPIKKLWRELAKGHAFPTCIQGASPTSSSVSMSHQFANARYCLAGYLSYDSDVQSYQCQLGGAVTVYESGVPTKRVWWGTPNEEQLVEDFGSSQRSEGLPQSNADRR